MLKDLPFAQTKTLFVRFAPFRGYFFFFAIPAFFCGYSGFLSRVNSKVDTAELKAMLAILSPAG